MKRVTRVAWSARETERFLLLQEEGKKAREIAKSLHRTLYAIQGVRRKLPKARRLAGRSRKRLVELLLVNEVALKRMRKSR
jgi:hypothetical protein